MSFSLKSFNEISTVGKKIKNQVEIIKGKATTEMEALKSEARANKRYFGHRADDFKQLYQNLFELGQILNANYFVLFEAYNENGTQNLPILQDSLTGYLATETNLPLIQAEFEAVKIGPFQLNQLTGIAEPDLQLTLLETADGRICNSVLDWRDLMVNEDGTVNPPASYAMRVTVGLFSKDYGLDIKPVQRTFIVAPSQSSIDGLVATGISELTSVPLTFSVLRNFME